MGEKVTPIPEEVEAKLHGIKNRLAAIYGDKASFYEDFLRFAYQAEAEDWSPPDFELPDDIHDRLVRGETRLDSSVLAELDRRNAVARLSQNVPPEVVNARKHLKLFFSREGRRTWLKEKGICIAYGGSLQWGDPKNFDADLIAFSDKRMQPADQEKLTDEIESSLISYWTGADYTIDRIGEEPHLDDFPLEIIADVQASFKTDPFDFYNHFSHTALALSAVPVFEGDMPWMRGFRQKTRQLVEKEPLLSAIANFELANCLKIREARSRGDYTL